MFLLKNWNRQLLLLQQKLEGVRNRWIGTYKTDYLKITKGSFYRELDQEEERCDDDQPVAE